MQYKFSSDWCVYSAWSTATTADKEEEKKAETTEKKFSIGVSLLVFGLKKKLELTTTKTTKSIVNLSV